MRLPTAHHKFLRGLSRSQNRGNPGSRNGNGLMATSGVYMRQRYLAYYLKRLSIQWRMRPESDISRKLDIINRGYKDPADNVLAAMAVH